MTVWVKRVSSAIKRARAAETPAAPKPVGVVADWGALISYAKSVQNILDENGDRRLPGMSDVSLGTLRARLGDVSPKDITDAHAGAAMIAAPAGKRESFRDAIRFLNKLIANRSAHTEIEHLLPTAPIGALPVLRDPALDWGPFNPEFLASRDAAIKAAMAPEPRKRTKDRFGGRLGPAALRGSAGGARGKKRRVTNKTVATKGHLAALSWLVRHAFDDVADAAGHDDLRDLLTVEAVERAAEVYVKRAKTSRVLRRRTRRHRRRHGSAISPPWRGAGSATRIWRGRSRATSSRKISRRSPTGK